MSRPVFAAGVLIAAFVILVGKPGIATAQVSPGPLARAHAELDGPLDCMRCHAKGEKGLDRQCLACHREIAATVEARRGLHGKGRLEDCARCHPDHAGEDFEMIAWEEGSESEFDHSKTIFALKGKHASAKCRDCHNAKLAVAPIAELSPRKDRSRGFVGLETSCAYCHEDPHRGVLGENCASCHGEDEWKPAKGFRHEDSGYPLTGKHEQTRCDACHRSERLGKPLAADGLREPLWKPLAHGECSDCHEDPHRDRLGPACATCHVTESFQKTDSKGFDHDKTRYPLRGKHRPLECAQCHDEKKAWGAKPRFEKCSDCHSDPHRGRFGPGGDRPYDKGCLACHGMDAFRPANFDIEDHSRSAYPLEGAHRTVPCIDCHDALVGGRSTKTPLRATATTMEFRERFARCVDCHRTPHGTQFDDRAECGSCHGIESFTPAPGFDHVKLTAFPLTGAHAGIACEKCHPRREGADGDREVVYRPIAHECQDCHGAAIPAAGGKRNED